MQTKVAQHPFRVIIQKEIGDTIRSWKFMIMMGILLVSCFSSLSIALDDFEAAVKAGADQFFFLNMFTYSDGTLPSFIVFIGFIGPLLGISMGFDSINSEYNNGTISRLVAQAIYRDYIINAKAIASLWLITIMLLAMSMLSIGVGIVIIGIPPSPEEVLRILSFTFVAVVYISFWLYLAQFFSVIFRQSATAALAAIAMWLFFSIFYGMLIGLVAKHIAPGVYAPSHQIYNAQVLLHRLQSINPEQLFNDAVSTLLIPSVRHIGPMMMGDKIGSLPTPIPLGQSIMVIWPQLTALLAAAACFFALTYRRFMKQEVRS